MQKINGTVRGFILGILATVAVLVLIGAVNHQTQNVGGDDIHSFQSVYASSDGKIVYVCDNYTVYRSNDGGENWSVVLKQSNTARQ